MFPFTLRQIEAFLSVAAGGSFCLAAEDLGVSQPAISRLIKSLELQLGYPLLDRRPGGGARLSPAGEAFRSQAENFMQSAQALGSSRNPRARNGVTPIRSYIGTHLLNEYLRPLLPNFYAEHPTCMLKLVSERPRTRVIRDIETGMLDFALFTTTSRVSAPAEKIGTVGSGIYSAPGYAISDTSLAAINAQPFVLPMSGSYEDALLIDEMRASGIAPRNVIARVNFSEGRLAVTAQGKCLCYSVDSAIKAFPQFKLLKLIDLPGWTRWLYISNRIHPDVSDSLRKLVKDAVGSP